jgi:hypothetical protein
MTSIKIQNTSPMEDGVLSEALIVVINNQNQPVRTHSVIPGDSKEIDLDDNESIGISRRWRDATPAPTPPPIKPQAE